MFSLLLCLCVHASFAQRPTAKNNLVDSAGYLNKMKQLANGDNSGRWPAKTPLPKTGAILPYNRVVAFYGNLYSVHMGILGALPKAEMLKKLEEECKAWRAADTSTPVLPALHYVAITAQASQGKDGMYRLRMPAAEIEKVISWAAEIHAIVFLDIQTGHSSVNAEITSLKKYLQLPQVHLGIDAEYAMKNGGVPCSSIGTFDAADVNDAIQLLSQVVKENNLPPKMLIVHRFTQKMITNYKQIAPTPEVQVVMNMDGFGAKSLKQSSFNYFIAREPVQFAGFKLFYKYDKPLMYTPKELLKLKPIPIYIQYQ